MARVEDGFPRWAWAAVAVAVVGALLAGVLLLRQPPAGPVELVWDALVCARCRMIVGEPGFAGQAHTERGEVMAFDDPGCLLLWIHEHPGDVRGAWVHHLREERWIPLDEVAFVPAAPTPMGYGFGAVEAEEAPPEAVGAAEALERIRARDAARGGG